MDDEHVPPRGRNPDSSYQMNGFQNGQAKDRAGQPALSFTSPGASSCGIKGSVVHDKGAWRQKRYLVHLTLQWRREIRGVWS